MQDIEGGYDKKLAEELAQIKRDQEVLVARFAHEEATLKKIEEEAEKAETLKELYRSEFELERVAQEVQQDAYQDLQKKFDDLSTKHYSRPPTPPMPKASVEVNDDAKRELEKSRPELINARGEIKDL